MFTPRTGRVVLGLLLSLVNLLMAGCTGANAPAEAALLFYNVQNLFDGQADGGEYPEFDPGKGSWNEEFFRARLAAFGEVFEAAAQGVPGGKFLAVCLAEVENSRVLSAVNQGPLREQGLFHELFLRSPGTATGLGLLSRYPLAGVRVHRPWFEGSRAMVEAELSLPGGSLTLFIAHWKSKIPDPASTEDRRRQAARLLAVRLKELEGQSREYLVLGDLNEGPEEYLKTGGSYPTALYGLSPGKDSDGRRGAGVLPLIPPPQGGLFELSPSNAAPQAAGVAPLLLVSPWLASGAPPGSYCHQGLWERIDHALLSTRLFDGRAWESRGFGVVAAPFMLDKRGLPRAYRNGRGFSDHLPVIVELFHVSDD